MGEEIKPSRSSQRTLPGFHLPFEWGHGPVYYGEAWSSQCFHREKIDWITCPRQFSEQGKFYIELNALLKEEMAVKQI